MKTCYTSLARINSYCFPFFCFQCGIILETEMQLQAATSHGTYPGTQDGSIQLKSCRYSSALISIALLCDFKQEYHKQEDVIWLLHSISKALVSRMSLSVSAEASMHCCSIGVPTMLEMQNLLSNHKNFLLLLRQKATVGNIKPEKPGGWWVVVCDGQ